MGYLKTEIIEDSDHAGDNHYIITFEGGPFDGDQVTIRDPNPGKADDPLMIGVNLEGRDLGDYKVDLEKLTATWLGVKRQFVMNIRREAP